MTERLNRRDQIIDSAAQLFFEHGYSATSVRQIADVVGCTEAALYYHFKEGKRELLQAVIECQIPNLATMIDACQHATSLPDMIRVLANTMSTVGVTHMEKMRWLLGEFPKLTADERELFYTQHLMLYDRARTIVQRFEPDARTASVIAYLIICTMMGYAQLFWNMDVASKVDLSLPELMDKLATWSASEYPE